MKNQLPNEEIKELKVAHKNAKKISANLSYRIHVIILLKSGMSPSAVSDIILLSRDTVDTYLKKYNAGGLAALLKTNYKGGKKKLTQEQIAILCKELDENVYLTTKAVCRFVLAEFGVEYSERGMAALLNSEGFTYKKPDLKPGNPDEALQEAFLEQFADFLKRRKEDDLIFFMDAVHPVHNVQPAYGWFRKGERREIKTNSGRDRYNIHGAMNADTYQVTAIFSEDNVNSTSTIELLKALGREHPHAKNIFVLLDNARYHFSSAVEEYVKSSRIKLVPLPSYSPEFNLIERFWKLFKKEVTYNRYYPTFAEFKKACLNFFKVQNKNQDKVFSIMGDGLLGFCDRD